ncbi:Alpha-carbonic anhydrase, partial [Fasciolopsis buskii]
SDWSYTNKKTNPETWGEHFPQCEGVQQSPINILTEYVKKDSNLKQVTMQPTKTIDQLQYTVENNGHSVQIVFPEDLWRISLHGESKGDYCAKQMHFHWGSTSSNGSEHTLDGVSYSIEAHLVTFNCKLYDAYKNASGRPYGLAVLGFWGQETTNLKESSTMFSVLGEVQSSLSNLNTESSVSITAFNLSNLLELVDTASFYRYSGSLTTPPCTANVIWTMFTKIIPVSRQTLELLRNLSFPATEEQPHMENNFRPVQALSSPDNPLPRTVYRSAGCVSMSNSFVLLLLYSMVCSVVNMDTCHLCFC